MVRRVISVTGNMRYADFIHVIVQRYNEAPHKSLFNNSPYDVYFGRRKISKAKPIVQNLGKSTLVHQILKKGTRVRIKRAKNSVFEKFSLRRWTKEIFKISKIIISDPIMHELIDLNGEEITGKFYREELQII